MIYLKIENGKGYFINSNEGKCEIDTIRKEDILFLLDKATDSSVAFEMDSVSNNSIQNEAHKIIYQSLFRKFNELLSNKNRFLDESEALFKDAFQKYKD